MSTTNQNCLAQCLRSNYIQDYIPNPFKNRKGKKCLTLVKKINEQQHPQSTLTIESITLQKTRVKDSIVPQFYNHSKRVKTDVSQELLVEERRPRIIWNRYAHEKQQISRNTQQLLGRYQQKRRLSTDYMPQIHYMNQSIELKSNSCSKPERYSQIIQFRQPFYEQRHRQSEYKQQRKKNISPIIQEEEREKRSSLYQGAQYIISKLKSSNKKPINNSNLIYETQKKQDKIDLRKFYDNARLCETQHAILYTTSSIVSSHENQPQIEPLQIAHLSFDAIPMSPKSKTYATFKDFKIGKLLGIGKWAHVYLCQQIQTRSIFALKQIFKKTLQLPISIHKVSQKIKLLMNLSHPKIMSIYAKFQTTDKICLVMQYCSKSLYDQIKQNKCLPISKVKTFLQQIIEGIVFLHQNDIIHGNISIFQTFINFNDCKIKPALTSSIFEKASQLLDYNADIGSLAIMAYEMAYGILIQTQVKDTLYEKQNSYIQYKLKLNVIKQIQEKVSVGEEREEYKRLNNFIVMLLGWNVGSRLTSGVCFGHQFFNQQNDKLLQTQ